MGVVTVAEMLCAESLAKDQGWSEQQLLDLAGTRLGHAIGRFFPRVHSAVAYLGKGHNAGDAIVALCVLRNDYGWEVAVRAAFPMDQCAPLVQKKWQGADILALDQPPRPDQSPHPLIVIDGLLGIGGRGGLRPPLLAHAEEISRLRGTLGVRVAAVDLPSGIDPDSGMAGPGAVIADVTFMIANAKLGLLTGHASHHVGALALVPVEALTAEGKADLELICPQTMTFGKSLRPFDFHKGMAGRIAVVAGSESYVGAAILAATGALRGGGGLVTLHVPHGILQMTASRCPVEVILRGYTSTAELREIHCDAMVVGCGLGNLETSEARHLLDLIAQHPAPMVVDADALNLIARHEMQSILHPQHVITPHPGEFRRLAPDLADLPREAAARDFVDRFPCTLLLKGSRTLVAGSAMPLRCNSTGSPAMASAGQGDLLAGVLSAGLAAGLSTHDAAAHAAWICGRAAEISLATGRQSEESLTALDTASALGTAFKDWRSGFR